MTCTIKGKSQLEYKEEATACVTSQYKGEATACVTSQYKGEATTCVTSPSLEIHFCNC